MRAAGAGAGLAGRGARPAPRGAPAAPRPSLLHALRRKPRPVRVRARAQRDIQQLPGVRAASLAERRRGRQRGAGRLRGVHERRRRRRRAGPPARRLAAQLRGRHTPRIREAWQGGTQRMDSRT